MLGSRSWKHAASVIVRYEHKPELEGPYDYVAVAEICIEGRTYEIHNSWGTLEREASAIGSRAAIYYPSEDPSEGKFWHQLVWCLSVLLATAGKSGGVMAALSQFKSG
jgi:hypothetical protein